MEETTKTSGTSRDNTREAVGEKDSSDEEENCTFN